ncbi:MAG: hypothetical protein HC834_03940, partial [Rhodospirillales bacterium]|nr:hypothetical protein [Rhodospirillales bacterium]
PKSNNLLLNYVIAKTGRVLHLRWVVDFSSSAGGGADTYGGAGMPHLPADVPCFVRMADWNAIGTGGADPYTQDGIVSEGNTFCDLTLTAHTGNLYQRSMLFCGAMVRCVIKSHYAGIYGNQMQYGLIEDCDVTFAIPDTVSPLAGITPQNPRFYFMEMAMNSVGNVCRNITARPGQACNPGDQETSSLLSIQELSRGNLIENLSFYNDGFAFAPDNAGLFRVTGHDNTFRGVHIKTDTVTGSIYFLYPQNSLAANHTVDRAIFESVHVEVTGSAASNIVNFGNATWNDCQWRGCSVTTPSSISFRFCASGSGNTIEDFVFDGNLEANGFNSSVVRVDNRAGTYTDNGIGTFDDLRLDPPQLSDYAVPSNALTIGYAPTTIAGGSAPSSPQKPVAAVLAHGNSALGSGPVVVTAAVSQPNNGWQAPADLSGQNHAAFMTAMHTVATSGYAAPMFNIGAGWVFADGTDASAGAAAPADPAAVGAVPLTGSNADGTNIRMSTFALDPSLRVAGVSVGFCFFGGDDVTQARLKGASLHYPNGVYTGSGESSGRIGAQGNALDYEGSHEKPAAGETILRRIIVDAWTLPPSMVESIANAGTAPSSAVVISIQKNTSEIGTLTFSAGETIGVFASAGGSFARGDLLTLVMPANTNGIAGLSYVIAGVVR